MNRMPGRIKHTVFLDAAVPHDGMSAQDQWETIVSEHKVVDGMVYLLRVTGPSSPWKAITMPNGHILAN